MSAGTFAGLIDNEVAISTRRFAAIIGLSPSKGARSPVLWNAAFAAGGIDAMMHPMDVTPSGLPALVEALKGDARFIGGAVAVPHKQAIAAHLDRLEPEAERIGAVNALYRDNGDLVGANTDGAAALSQIEAMAGGGARLKARHALVVGLGGAGAAVAAYLAGRVASLHLVNRTPRTAKELARRLDAKAAAFPIPRDLLAATDLLVNATTLGHQDGPQGSAVPGDMLAALPATAMVYDVIYQPSQTPLLAAAAARGLTTCNGLGMNLDQAVIAFTKALPDALGIDRIRQAMQAA